MFRRSFLVVIVAFGFAACSKSVEGPDIAPATMQTEQCVASPTSTIPVPADSSIAVGLKEWTIKTSTAQANAGTIRFAVANVGKQNHELAVVQGTAASLPTKPDGSIDEARLAEGAIRGRVSVRSGAHCVLELRLGPGRYTLMCNLAQGMAAGGAVHYVMGMSAPLTVQ